MTTILLSRNFKFKINDRDHLPPHVHVEGGGATVRINLLTLEVMDKKHEFSVSTMRIINLFVAENRETFLQEWVKRHETK